MTEYSVLFKGFIFGAIGTAFGWSLNQLSHWISSKKEDKRYIKHVLFNLLEAYNIFNRADIKKFVNSIIQEVTKKMPIDLQTDEGKEILQKIFYEFAEKSMFPELVAELKGLQPRYETSIVELAPIDPITAYYLSGKSSLLDRFETIQKLVKELINNNFPENEKSNIEADQLLSNLKPTIINETLNDLEKDVLQISQKIGFQTYLNARRLIKW